MAITIHKAEDFEKMRNAGKLAAEILDYIIPFVEVGVTTEQLNDLCHQKIIENGAIPAPLNYKGFPKSICTSVNNVICHGIPGKRKLKNRDILNIDVTVILDGWYGDTSRMYYVGEPSTEAKKLCQVTYDAMMLGIEQAKVGNKLGDIGFAIQNYVEKHGYSVVRDYCGHGIGRVFHTEPNIVHYGKKNTGLELQEGMFFTVEPMVNIGRYETVLNKSDNWTVSTIDGSLSAQFEHTIAVTKNGPEIFTISPLGLNFPPYKI
jgi:methionyl aminopeptidase